MTEWKNKIKEQIVENDGRNVIAEVTSVARSGMSRYIKFAVSINGDIRPLTWWIAETCGKNYDDYKGVRVRGCGMDMIFATLYNFYKTALNLDSGTASTLAGHYRTF